LGEFERTAWEDWRGQLGRIGEDSLGGLEGTAWEDWRGQLRRIGENSLGGLEKTAGYFRDNKINQNCHPDRARRGISKPPATVNAIAHTQTYN